MSKSRLACSQLPTIPCLPHRLMKWRAAENDEIAATFDECTNVRPRVERERAAVRQHQQCRVAELCQVVGTRSWQRRHRRIQHCIGNRRRVNTRKACCLKQYDARFLTRHARSREQHDRQKSLHQFPPPRIPASTNTSAAFQLIATSLPANDRTSSTYRCDAGRPGGSARRTSSWLLLVGPPASSPGHGLATSSPALGR